LPTPPTLPFAAPPLPAPDGDALAATGLAATTGLAAAAALDAAAAMMPAAEAGFAAALGGMTYPARGICR